MQSSRSYEVDAIETEQLRRTQQKPVSKLPRDIPVATALGRIYKVVGSALQNHNMALHAPGIPTIND